MDYPHLGVWWKEPVLGPHLALYLSIYLRPDIRKNMAEPAFYTLDLNGLQGQTRFFTDEANG